MKKILLISLLLFGLFLPQLAFGAERVTLQDGTGNELGTTANPLEVELLDAGGSAFTQGSVVFAGSGGALTQDNANLFWDDSGNKLGIGVNSSLLADLDVLGGVGGALVARFRRTNAVVGYLGLNVAGGEPQILYDVNNATYQWSAGADLSTDAFMIGDGAALGTDDMFTVKAGGFIGVGTNAPTATLQIGARARSGASGHAGGWFYEPAATYTDSATAGSGTAASFGFNNYAQPTLAATNASVTTTNAATMYITGAPIAGTNMTITNDFSLWIDSGKARFDGNILAGTGAGEEVTSPTAAIDLITRDAQTNAIAYPFVVDHTTTGTATTGFGTGILYKAERSDGTVGNLGTITMQWSDAVAGGEDADLIFSPMYNSSSVGTERMRILGVSGNVGIGTSAPVYKLSVAGTMRADDFYSGDGTQGSTDATSWWLCSAADCSTKCQVSVKDGLIVGCT